MKLLVTGVSGFVGNNFAQRRIAHGDTVVAITRPETNKALLPRGAEAFDYDGNQGRLVDFIRYGRFDGIVHLATHFCVAHTTKDIEKLVDANIRFGTQLLDAATKASVPWFVNTSTYTQYYKDRTYSPVNLYAATKKAFEDIAQYYAETATTTLPTITLFDTMGPGDRRNKLVQVLLRAAQTGGRLDLSPGEQFIDISPIQNVLDGYDRMITLLQVGDHAFLRGRVFALPSNERMRLKSFIRLFEEVLGRKLPVHFGAREYREREVMMPWTRGETLPGWKPQRTIRESLEEIIRSEL